MAGFEKVANLSELNKGGVKGVKVGGDQIALYKLGDAIFATSDICTHEECVISENFYVEGEEVECTCHGSRFDIRSGENTVPPAAEPLKTYPVKIDGEDILVGV